MSFCHHLASVAVVHVCKLFIFSSSSLKPLNRFGPNLAEMFIGWSSTKFVILVQIGNPTWLPGPIMCSDWLKLWKSSCQKLRGRWNCNIIEMMTGWSSTKFVIFVLIAYPRWPPQGNNSFSFKDLFLRNYLTKWIFLHWFYTWSIILVQIGNPTWLIDAKHYDFSVNVTNFGPKLRCYGQQSTCYGFPIIAGPEPFPI